MNWIQGALKLIPLIVTAVNAVEKLFFNKEGKDKKAAALEIIGDAIQSIEEFAGKDLMADAEFKKLVGEMVDSYVAIQNYIAAHPKRTDSDN
jgi:hypothetical protein